MRPSESNGDRLGLITRTLEPLVMKTLIVQLLIAIK